MPQVRERVPGSRAATIPGTKEGIRMITDEDLARAKRTMELAAKRYQHMLTQSVREKTKMVEDHAKEWDADYALRERPFDVELSWPKVYQRSLGAQVERDLRRLRITSAVFRTGGRVFAAGGFTGADPSAPVGTVHDPVIFDFMRPAVAVEEIEAVRQAGLALAIKDESSEPFKIGDSARIIGIGSPSDPNTDFHRLFRDRP